MEKNKQLNILINVANGKKCSLDYRKIDKMTGEIQCLGCVLHQHCSLVLNIISQKRNSYLTIAAKEQLRKII